MPLSVIERWDEDNGQGTRTNFACEELGPLPAGSYQIQGGWSATFSRTSNIAITVDRAGSTDVSYVAAGTLAVVPMFSAGTSITPALPAGWAIGDLLILEATDFNLIGSVQSVADPTGWTRITYDTFKDTAGSATSYHQHGLWYKIAASGETNPTLNYTGANQLFNELNAKVAAWRDTASAPYAYGSSYGVGGVGLVSDSATVSAPVHGELIAFLAAYAINPTASYTPTAPSPPIEPPADAVERFWVALV